MLTKKELQLKELRIAAKRLDEALEKEKDDIVRDAVIQRFEFTFELTWKLLLTINRENGMEFKGVKTVFRDEEQIAAVLDQNDLLTCIRLKCPMVNTMWLVQNQPAGCMVSLEIEDKMPTASGFFPTVPVTDTRRRLTEIVVKGYKSRIPRGCP